jgi:N6-adenosine-specific RNA methylase IME4
VPAYSFEKAYCYGAILCDPPWKFRTYDGKKTVASRTAADPYPTMSLADLKRIPVDLLPAKDCALFMWAVDAHLEHALELGRAWGFTYKTIAFIWDKGRIGMGYWSRKEAEICLLFTKGSPRRIHKDVRQIIRAPRREHSRKPRETHDLVERLVAGPYIELFSRETVAGWGAWGLETGMFDPLTASIEGSLSVPSGK